MWKKCTFLSLEKYFVKTIKPLFFRSQSFRFDGNDLLNTIGLSGEDWLDLNALMLQAKDLVKLFIEHGADVNLQTTNSGRTIFHEVLANEVSDHELIDRMVTLGALVNLTGKRIFLKNSVKSK